MTYAGSGVNINAGNRAVKLIKGAAERTFKFIDGKTLAGIGGFSAAIEKRDGSIVAASTDGVGTKLAVAILMNKHDTVGNDLVAMCVNDLIVGGVMPDLFLDYLATGKLIPERANTIINGIANGCALAECGLVGGEMAEMPGFYSGDDYDLAGFAVGFAKSREDLILGNKIKPGMRVYGLPSSGLHSNGYSLARKLFNVNLRRPKTSIRNLGRYYKELEKTLGEELLTPTKIYVKEVKRLITRYEIAGMAHITGGGIAENSARILPSNCALLLNTNAWPVPPIFPLIQKLGNVSTKEMRRTFNNGIGLVVITPNKISENFPVLLIGEVIERTSKMRKVTFREKR